MVKSWDELKPGFREVVRERGVRGVAEGIPASLDTVYRLFKDETKRPTTAVRAGVERMIEERSESDGLQSNQD